MDFATEKGYIEAVSRGDEQAFESLFLHYFPRIKGFISGILQNEEEAEDISQDIFVSMWQNNHWIIRPHGSSGRFVFVGAASFQRRQK